MLAYIFSIAVGVTAAIYLLRGWGILTFIPGGILWLSILLSAVAGIFYGIQKTRRY